MRKKPLEFEVVEHATAKVELESAVLVYSASGVSEGVFATVHAIHHDDKGVATILPGKAMTGLAVARLARRLSKREPGGFIPPNLLYQDATTMAWWVQPARRQIWFRSDADKLGAPERAEVVPHPGLVFAASSSRAWRVWAVKGADRPCETTELYQAPYFNVYAGGGICQGNVDVPGRTTADKIDAWNAAFFESWFTHPNVQGPLVKYRGGGYAFWRDMLDGRHHEFPEHVLVATGKTLADALKEGRRHDT